MPGDGSENILFAMLRSYTVVARTLNLSHAVKEIGSTRQTIGRHIKALEKALGGKLFVVKDKQYQLTKFGSQALHGAERILKDGSAWLKGEAFQQSPLEHVKAFAGDELLYFSQQHKINRLWVDGTALLQKGFDCWARAKTNIESSELTPIRPYLTIYRPIEEGWVCVEIGEKSTYALWHGWEWAKSSVGHIVKDTPTGSQFASHVLRSYCQIYDTGGCRFDHLYRSGPRSMKDALAHVCFQRLILGCTFPDGSSAVAVLADISADIEIEGVSQTQVDKTIRNLSK